RALSPSAVALSASVSPRLAMIPGDGSSGNIAAHLATRPAGQGGPVGLADPVPSVYDKHLARRRHCLPVPEVLQALLVFGGAALTRGVTLVEDLARSTGPEVAPRTGAAEHQPDPQDDERNAEERHQRRAWAEPVVSEAPHSPDRSVHLVASKSRV